MRGFDVELDHILHPASIFDHPREVLNDPDLTIQEKRAILSSWASDACAVEEIPALRQPPGGKRPISFVEIVDVLRSLDDDRNRRRRGGVPMRLKRRRWGRDDDGATGTPLS